MAIRQKFATQVDPEILQRTKDIAAQEGRQLQSVIEEALTDFVEKHTGSRPRPAVMAHYEASLASFGPLYERLAK